MNIYIQVFVWTCVLKEIRDTALHNKNLGVYEKNEIMATQFENFVSDGDREKVAV